MWYLSAFLACSQSQLKEKCSYAPQSALLHVQLINFLQLFCRKPHAAGCVQDIPCDAHVKTTDIASQPLLAE
jgi:hypothetical protein